MPSNSNDPDPPTAEQAIERLALQTRLEAFVNTMDAAVRRLKGPATELVRVRKASGQPNAFHVVRYLENINDALQVAELQAACADLLAEYRRAVADAVLRLEADLKDACAHEGWVLDGQWPTYYVQRVIRVHIDEAAGRARVGDTAVAILAIATIVAALQAQHRELLPKAFQPAQFLNALCAAYDRVASGEHRSVPIWSLYREMLLALQPKSLWRTGRPEAFKPYPEQRFRASLTTLLHDGVTRTSDGRELRLLPALKAEEGMYLYHPMEQRFAYAGRVDFAPTAGEEHHE